MSEPPPASSTTTSLLTQLTKVMSQPTTMGQVKQLAAVMGELNQLKKKVKRLSCMDWLTLSLAMLYVVSPIDLIPDPIPILGLMDDLAVISSVVIPLLINQTQE